MEQKAEPHFGHLDYYRAVRYLVSRSETLYIVPTFSCQGILDSSEAQSKDVNPILLTDFHSG